MHQYLPKPEIRLSVCLLSIDKCPAAGIRNNGYEGACMNFKFDLLIDGALVKGANKLDVINPATGEVFRLATPTLIMSASRARQ